MKLECNFLRICENLWCEKFARNFRQGKMSARKSTQIQLTRVQIFNYSSGSGRSIIEAFHSSSHQKHPLSGNFIDAAN